MSHSVDDFWRLGGFPQTVPEYGTHFRTESCLTRQLRLEFGHPNFQPTDRVLLAAPLVLHE